jgi:hypothetical protein
VYEAPVWPSNAERDPAPSVFPDFTRPATREWWGGLFKFYTDAGVAGIWNDMNEPAVFTDPAHTMALDVRHDGEGQPTDEREIHNVYGMLNSRATFEGLARLRPDERPFVLTRATFAGGQRYAALWPGDNVSSWAHLRATIPMFANLGLSGFSFVGADIGGFAEAPTAELYTRWLQLGVFYPFMRTHTTFGTPDQEPWSYGTFHEALNRRAIEMRYELLPHIFNVMEEASRTGIPAFRPLLLEYPDDPATWDRDDEFLFGSDLLVAPVLREEAGDREVYLPAGDWYDYYRGWRSRAGARHLIPVTMEAIPVLRGGVIFRQPVVQHTPRDARGPGRVAVSPPCARGEPLRGRRRRPRATPVASAGAGASSRSATGRVTIEVAAAEGLASGPRDVLFEVGGRARPGHRGRGRALARTDAQRLATDSRAGRAPTRGRGRSCADRRSAHGHRGALRKGKISRGGRVMAVVPERHQALRERARKHIENGAVTENHVADRKTVIRILNEARPPRSCACSAQVALLHGAGDPRPALSPPSSSSYANEEQGPRGPDRRVITQLGGTPNLNPEAHARMRSHPSTKQGDTLEEMIMRT